MPGMPTQSMMPGAPSQSMMPSGSMMPGMPGMDGMVGMMSPQDMAALQNAQGVEAAKLFLTQMIQHRQGAITMVAAGNRYWPISARDRDGPFNREFSAAGDHQNAGHLGSL